MYIMVQNAGEIPMHGIRLLGLSTKNQKQIGQFGTGLKEALCLCLRDGVEFVIFSGELRVDFEIIEREGQDEVCFRLSEDRLNYKAGDWHGLGMHRNFGARDWTDAYQVLREVICNAYDESGDDMVVTTVSEMEGVAGSTRVYIDADFHYLAAFGTVPNKLLFCGKPEIMHVDSDNGRLIAKSKELGEKAQIFTKGVWVQQSADQSLFDYEINNLKLNEARSADWWDIHYRAAKLLGSGSAKALKQLFSMVRTLGIQEFEKTFEGELTGSYMSSSASKAEWQEAWDDIYGPGMVACPPIQMYVEILKRKGYSGVLVPQNIYEAIKGIGGIVTVDALINDDDREQLEVIDHSSDVFDIVWERLQSDLKIIPLHKTPPPVKYFSEPTDNDDNKKRHGFVRAGAVYINVDIAGSVEEWYTCVEEALHHGTGLHDNSDGFQSFLIEALTKLAVMPDEKGNY